jgi:hypothetical protein
MPFYSAMPRQQPRISSALAAACSGREMMIELKNAGALAGDKDSILNTTFSHSLADS